MRRATLALALLSGLSPLAALAAEPATYAMDVEVSRDGRTVSASVEAPAGGSGVATTERRIPYPAAVASADADDIPEVASIVVANSFRLAPVERPDGLRLSAEIRLSRLVGMKRFEAPGRAIELPDVETVDVALSEVAMRPEGDAWVYEGDDAGTGAHLRVVARR